MPKDTTQPSDTLISNRKKSRIARPPNSWILFRADMLRDPDFRAQYPNAHQHVISKALSVLWRNASKEVKEEYERRAEGAKLKHMILHPDYVYRPQRKVRAATVAGGEESKGKSRPRAKRGHKSKCNDDSSAQSFESIINDHQACSTGELIFLLTPTIIHETHPICLQASSTSQEPLTALPIPLIPFTSQSYSEISTTHVSETQQSSAVSPRQTSPPKLPVN
ncbi:hypothetical protein C8R41DRAFT_764961 [Lentinula lateritia]|uniref:HMG box domain-containing protein n=1 Tax=Lentinula lateritia TaxID=40482 RepID=A0ABQ8VFY0_9AGAR|nr:hypothetical protein C8R41DRAFT_764961 [Lentinula lateritia]